MGQFWHLIVLSGAASGLPNKIKHLYPRASSSSTSFTDFCNVYVSGATVVGQCTPVSKLKLNAESDYHSEFMN